MAEALEQFRLETRDWLANNCPEGARGPGFIPWGSHKVELEADTRLWLKLMSDKGWTVPTWPKEYGGAGLSKAEYLVLQSEMQAINARPALTGRGVNYIGPTILEFGTEAQKEKWLPRCASGDGGWCMGYSEPAAGSDLANLQLRCQDEGDVFRLNGMKTWTSDGLYGDWIFCLVRTDPEKPKHEGISLVLVDMNQEGVRVRPIQLISGNSPFCETFFEGAIADKEDLIGPRNQGWAVGKRLLQYERSVHGGVNTSGAQVIQKKASLADMAKQYMGQKPDGRLDNDMFRQRLLKLQMNRRAYALTQKRVIAETKASAPALATSILKIKGAEFTKERAEILQHIMGFRGFGLDQHFNADEREANLDWLSSRAVSIYGGSSEIQMNIIAKRVLGLPG